MLSKHYENSWGLDIRIAGPAFNEKDIPTIFYFSLSAKESLEESPFNSPVSIWAAKGLRVISATLPYHGEGFDRKQGVDNWGKDFQEGGHALIDFFDLLEAFSKDLFERSLLEEGKAAVAGLSRGAFVATHLAARVPAFRFILGYAPMTRLSSQPGFSKIKEDKAIQALSLYHLADKLEKAAVRFYIGNNDTRVGTEHCFHFIHTLAKRDDEKGIRSPPVELYIHPSAGHMGHGTLPPVFQKGADWILGKLDKGN